MEVISYLFYAFVSLLSFLLLILLYIMVRPLKVKHIQLEKTPYLYTHASPEEKNQREALRRIYFSLNKSELRQAKGIGIYNVHQNIRGKIYANHLPSRVGCILDNTPLGKPNSAPISYETDYIPAGEYLSIQLPYNLLTPLIGATRVHQKLNRFSCDQKKNAPIIEIVDTKSSKVIYLKAYALEEKTKETKKNLKTQIQYSISES